MCADGVALVYRQSGQAGHVGRLCLRALEPLTTVRCFPPHLATRIPEAFGLALYIADEAGCPSPVRFRPSALWIVSSRCPPPQVVRKAHEFGATAAAQKSVGERLRAAGMADCEWLPLACGARPPRDRPAGKEWDVVFAGRLGEGARRRVFEELRHHLPECIAEGALHDQAPDLYYQARIVVCYGREGELVASVFEALASGALVLANRQQESGQAELFRDRYHLVEYSTPYEAAELARHYLCHPDERETIAAQGRAAVLANHTYRQRAEHLLALARRRVPACDDARALDRDRRYYEWPRPELLGLIPADARRLLDVGCGAGVLGEAVKRRQTCEVVGIELHPEAAAEAARRLDQVVAEDAETTDLGVLGTFDAIVCGDVLEHLRDPGTLLSRLRTVLSPTGVVVASLPNARHLDVLQQLAEGNWTYEAAGLLDRDHLRFFTRRSVEQLFAESGFGVAAVRGVPAAGHQGWVGAGRPTAIRAGRLAIRDLSAEEAEEFFIEQWLVVARPSPPHDWGLTSIVVLAHNQVEYTRLCLQSIRKHTHLPHELIVVDNGSSDGTQQLLRSTEGVRVITNPTNVGFSKGVNQGLRAAEGTNLLLLNNDTVVTPGWLPRLLRCLYSEPSVGAVGPLTNAASGPQQIPVPYPTLAGLDGFAWDLGRGGGEYQEVARVVGFCLLMRREVFEKIGPFDEQFGLGTFEDDDYCLRIRKAGYRLLINRGCFIHHFAGRTIASVGVDPQRLLTENYARFRDKWQGELPAEYASLSPCDSARAPRCPPAETPLQGPAALAEPPPCTAAPPSPRVSLCMIVRDEEPRIAACLESVRPWVDEMIVVDTGSTDGTADIARALGARVIDHAWQESFSEARNVSLGEATGDWIFWMDADDVLPPESGPLIRECAARAGDSITGFVAQVRCPAAPGEAGETVVDHVRLFRNLPEARFELRIHEQILPSIRRIGGEIARSPVTVVHANYDHSPEGQKRKRARDEKLLALDLAENPDHPFVHFNVGMTASHEGDHGRAIEHLRESIRLSSPQESHVRKAYALLAASHRARGEAELALAACREGRRIYPQDAELLFNEGLAWQRTGDLPRAADCLQRLLDLPQESDYLGSVDPGIFSYKARHNLAAIQEQMGNFSQAEACWRRAIAEKPELLSSWIALTELLVRQGRKHDVESLAHGARRCGQMAAYHLVQGRAALEGHGAVAAERHLRAAVAHAPTEAHAFRLLSHAMLQRGEREEVLAILQRLTELAPGDAEARHNMAGVLLEAGREAEAMAQYQRALQLEPDYAPSREMLRKMAGPAHESPASAGAEASAAEEGAD
jgi:GT2 family glycosyltransferase/tetratricopeptide (TPR) repeat protein/2-polyprenyl-3-methyl-5-hydroxy-6-metoxy-1,4-benzoquinol methylase